MFDVLDDFLIYCEVERRLSPLTCRAYQRDVRACLTFLEAEGIADLATVTVRDLRRFLAEEATRRPAPSSQPRSSRLASSNPMAVTSTLDHGIGPNLIS